MKKILIYMASAFFSFNLAAAALPLDNGGFDLGGRGWKLCRMSKVSDNDGNKVLLINDNDPKKGSSVWSSSLKIKGGAYYKIAFRARSLQAGEKRGIAGLYVRFFASDGKEIREQGEIAESVPCDAVNWQKYTFVVQAPVNAAALKIWIHSFNAAVGKVAFDDISVSESSREEYGKYGKKTVQKKSRSGFVFPSKQKIAEIEKLIPDTNYLPGPPVTDREFWGKLAKLKTARNIIAKAEKVNKEPVPVMTDDMYLDFTRTGSRKICGRIRGIRSRAFHNLVLAECLENKGRFIRKIEQYIQSFLDMKTWVGPPHDRNLANFKGKYISVDLMAVAAANQLSAAYSLLKPKLGPALKVRLKSDIERRIINPYLKHCRAGNAGEGFWWLIGTNNWTAVCNAGVVYTSVIVADSKEVRAEVIACALESIKNFLKGFSEDGYCSEGIGYWVYGYGNFLFMGEVLKRYTDGRINVFDSPKAKKAALFPENFELINNIYPAYADCPLSAKVVGYSAIALSRNFGIPLRSEKSDKLRGNLEQILLNNVLDLQVPVGSLQKDLRSFFGSAGILVCRQKAIDGRFLASIKAGHNSEHHNHNDVGSYVVLLDGFMPNCDPGREIYTSRTFSSRRYDSKLLNSWGHPVPVAGGMLQSLGAAYAGRIIRKEFSDDKDCVTIDLKPTYRQPALVRLERDFCFDRKNNTVTVKDIVEFSKPETFETAMVTYGKFKIVSPREVILYNNKTRVRAVITVTGGTVKITLEKIDEDTGGAKPWRLGIKFTKPVKQASVTIRYEKALD